MPEKKTTAKKATSKKSKASPKTTTTKKSTAKKATKSSAKKATGNTKAATKKSAKKATGKSANTSTKAASKSSAKASAAKTTKKPTKATKKPTSKATSSKASSKTSAAKTTKKAATKSSKATKATGTSAKSTAKKATKSTKSAKKTTNTAAKTKATTSKTSSKAAAKTTKKATTKSSKATKAAPKSSKTTAKATKATKAPKAAETLRVYALAKELGLASKDLLAQLQAAGLAVKSIQSNVERDAAEAALSAPQKSKPKKTSKKASTRPASAKKTGAKKAASKSKKSTKKAAKTDDDGLPEELLARVQDAADDTDVDPVEHFSRLTAHRADKASKKPIDEPTEDDLFEDWEDDSQADEPEVDEPLNEEPLSMQPKRKVHAHLKKPKRDKNHKRDTPRQDRHFRDEDTFDELDAFDDGPSTDSVPSGMVKIKSFHPDVEPGGRYIEQFVPADQVPHGAIVVSGQPRSAPNREQRRPRSSDQDSRQAMLPPGGILEAGRKLMSEGRLQRGAEGAQSAPSQPIAPPKPPSPPATSPAAPAPGSSPAAPGRPGLPGVGAGFLQGLPTANRVGNAAAQSAKDALNAAFGGGPAASKPAAPATAGPAAPGPRPAAPRLPATPPRGTTQSRGRSMILDGRLIETAGDQQDEGINFQRLRALAAPHEEMRIFELQLAAQKQKPVDAHALLWREGQIGIMGRVNDSDPRPRVWVEEGIFGLGRDEREQDLQRWSLREWWEGLEDKGHTPIASFAGTRTIRDTMQVAFVYDADYNIYRLYQPAGLELAGDYPMLIVAEGFIKVATISLDGVGERERITPERMSEILGEHNPPSPADLIFTAAPCMREGKALPLQAPEHLSLLRDQLDGLFRFPVLELPDPLGGTGSIKLHLGLWEMSQDDDNGSALRAAAASERSLTFKASAGYISDLVRRELWRMKGQPGQLWNGYTPKQVAEAIRVALREDHYNMQGFQPKKPGDYCYDPETGAFQIVLKRKHSTHTLLMRGHDGDGDVLCALVMYSSHKDNEGLNPLTDYAHILQTQQWTQLWPNISWQDAWLLAPGGESRCAWAGPQGLPNTPAVRHMPAWHRGVALGLFLMSF